MLSPKRILRPARMCQPALANQGKLSHSPKRTGDWRLLIFSFALLNHAFHPLDSSTKGF